MHVAALQSHQCALGGGLWRHRHEAVPFNQPLHEGGPGRHRDGVVQGVLVPAGLEHCVGVNLVVSEWPSLAAAQAWVGSAELAAVEPQRTKAYRIIRQYIVEMPA